MVAFATTGFSQKKEDEKPLVEVKEVKAQKTTDTLALFFIFKNIEALNDVIAQMQQDGRPVAVEGAFYTEGKQGELVPLKDGEDPDKKHAKLIAMNWGDLPEANDANSIEHRIRGFIDLDHPLVWPIKGGKGGYQVEVICIVKNGEKNGPKGSNPIYGFLDLKKTLANKLSDGTTYQVLVSKSKPEVDKSTATGKSIFENVTCLYYSANEKNFSFENSSNKILIDCKKVIPVRIHWTKIKKGMLVDVQAAEKGAKCRISGWGLNTLSNPGAIASGEKPQYQLPVVKNK